MKMYTNRLLNVSIAVALITLIALTIWQSIETTKVVSAASQQNAAYCISGIERLSMTSVYVEQARAWIPYTGNGPTGVDGGLLELLSNSRSCATR